MGALLVEEWLSDQAGIRLVDEPSISEVREATRATCKQVFLEQGACEGLVTAASELSRNALLYGAKGRVFVHTVERCGVPGVEVIVADAGNGIEDPRASLSETPGSRHGLGSGLAGAYRLAQEMDFDVRKLEGTCLRARAFVKPVPRTEVAILGRPLQDIPPSGDHAGVSWSDRLLVVSVVDGLGHGREARNAADRAIGAFHANAIKPPSEVLRACDERVRGSRGSVMSVASIDLERSELCHAGVGNIGVVTKSIDHERRLPSISAVLGSRGVQRVRDEVAAFKPGSVLVMHSDGLSSRLGFADNPHLKRQPPVVIAEELLERFGQNNDDGLVLVVRFG